MPKGNNYQSLHTAVLCRRWPRAGGADPHPRHAQPRRAGRGGALALQGRQRALRQGGDYDEKIALLRSLLSWRDEVTDSADWVEQFKRASLDDTIYVLTPQGRVIDLPRGATPIDFAYRVHTDLGHRCRGAKVNGQLVTLNTPLESGQTVEIMSTKEGGPSRDWLNAHQGYVATPRARRRSSSISAPSKRKSCWCAGAAVRHQGDPARRPRPGQHRRPGDAPRLQERRGAVHRRRAGRGGAARDPGGLRGADAPMRRPRARGRRRAERTRVMRVTPS
jgi:GTP pyrophosphokinase